MRASCKRLETTRWSVLLLAALAVGCGGAKVTPVYDDPQYSGQMHRLLLLSPGLVPEAADYGRRQLVEAFASRGVEVKTRDAFFSASEQLTREKLVAVLEQSDLDGVLVVGPGGIQREDRGRASFQDARGSYSDFQDEIGYLFSVGGNVAPVYRETDTRISMRARLYPLATGRLAWERLITLENPGSYLDFLDKVSPRIAAEAVGSGLIARP